MPTITLPILFDTALRVQFPTAPQATDTELYLHDAGANVTPPGGQTDRNRLLLKADTSALRSNMLITSATLNLYADQHTGEAAPINPLIMPVTRDCDANATWSSAKAGVPWVSPGGDFDFGIQEVIANPIQPTDLNRFLPVDLTTLAQYWADGSIPNFGFLVWDPNTGSNKMHRFASMENATVPNRPYISVAYETQTGPPGARATFLPAAVARDLDVHAFDHWQDYPDQATARIDMQAIGQGAPQWFWPAFSQADWVGFRSWLTGVGAGVPKAFVAVAADPPDRSDAQIGIDAANVATQLASLAGQFEFWFSLIYGEINNTWIEQELSSPTGLHAPSNMLRIATLQKAAIEGVLPGSHYAINGLGNNSPDTYLASLYALGAAVLVDQFGFTNNSQQNAYGLSPANLYQDAILWATLYQQERQRLLLARQQGAFSGRDTRFFHEKLIIVADATLLHVQAKTILLDMLRLTHSGSIGDIYEIWDPSTEGFRMRGDPHLGPATADYPTAGGVYPTYRALQRLGQVLPAHTWLGTRMGSTCDTLGVQRLAFAKDAANFAMAVWAPAKPAEVNPPDVNAAISIADIGMQPSSLYDPMTGTSTPITETRAAGRSSFVVAVSDYPRIVFFTLRPFVVAHPVTLKHNTPQIVLGHA